MKHLDDSITRLLRKLIQHNAHDLQDPSTNYKIAEDRSQRGSIIMGKKRRRTTEEEEMRGEGGRTTKKEREERRERGQGEI